MLLVWFLLKMDRIGCLAGSGSNINGYDHAKKTPRSIGNTTRRPDVGAEAPFGAAGAKGEANQK